MTDAAGATGSDEVVVTVNPAPAALERPRRDGDFLVDPAGRAFVGRGVDYSSDTIGIIDYKIELTDADLDRFAEWGMNLLEAVNGPHARSHTWSIDLSYRLRAFGGGTRGRSE